jgi:hypothetical protein
MHISELIVEQQLDELNLAGVSKGIGKVANTVGKVAGNVQGAYLGAQDAFDQGLNQTSRIAQRNVSRAANKVRPNRQASNQTAQPNTQPQQTPPQQTPPQGGAGQPPVQPQQAAPQSDEINGVTNKEIKQAANDARSRDPSQQSLGDKIVIKQSNTIHESEQVFHSKFLGRIL